MDSSGYILLTAYQANSLSIVLQDLLSIEHLLVDSVLLECDIKFFLYHVVDVVKWVFSCITFINSLQSANVLNDQTGINDINTRQTILLHLPRGTGKV